MAETIDGVETVFTWDLALDVPQVLATSDGTKSLYGLDRIGVEQAGAWRYTLADALGSVRQWTDPAGAVVGVQSCRPAVSRNRQHIRGPSHAFCALSMPRPSRLRPGLILTLAPYGGKPGIETRPTIMGWR